MKISQMFLTKLTFYSYAKVVETLMLKSILDNNSTFSQNNKQIRKCIET